MRYRIVASIIVVISILATAYVTNRKDSEATQVPQAVQQSGKKFNF